MAVDVSRYRYLRNPLQKKSLYPLPSPFSRFASKCLSHYTRAVPLRTLRVLRGRGQSGGKLDGGWRIAPSLFAEPAAPVSTERLPPPWGRGGTSLEKGERLFQGNPGWGQQATRAASFCPTHLRRIYNPSATAPKKDAHKRYCKKRQNLAGDHK